MQIQVLGIVTRINCIPLPPLLFQQILLQNVHIKGMLPHKCLFIENISSVFQPPGKCFFDVMHIVQKSIAPKPYELQNVMGDSMMEYTTRLNFMIAVSVSWFTHQETGCEKQYSCSRLSLSGMESKVHHLEFPMMVGMIICALFMLEVTLLSGCRHMLSVPQCPTFATWSQ